MALPSPNLSQNKETADRPCLEWLHLANDVPEMPLLLPCVLLFLILLPAEAAFAHVKWFVPLDHDLPPDFVRYGFGDPAVQVWVMLATTMIAASVWLDRKLPALPLPRGTLHAWIIRSLYVLTGLSLLLSAEAGSLIAPHYQWQGAYAQALLVLEVLVGLLLLFPPLVFIGAWALLLLYAGLALHYGPVEVLEYLNVAGTAAFLLCSFHPSAARRAQLQPYAVPALRILTGVALVTLGFNEKLLRPDYAEDFVQTYMWNFMSNLGMENYTDRLFVLSAGVMEVVFGLILILGTTTRLNILAVSGFMLSSNITFFVEGNLREAVTEIIGHMPIIATAIICVCFGSGQKLKFSALFRRPGAVYSSA